MDTLCCCWLIIDSGASNGWMTVLIDGEDTLFWIGTIDDDDYLIPIVKCSRLAGFVLGCSTVYCDKVLIFGLFLANVPVFPVSTALHSQ